MQFDGKKHKKRRACCTVAAGGVQRVSESAAVACSCTSCCCVCICMRRRAPARSPSITTVHNKSTSLLMIHSSVCSTATCVFSTRRNAPACTRVHPRHHTHVTTLTSVNTTTNNVWQHSSLLRCNERQFPQMCSHMSLNSLITRVIYLFCYYFSAVCTKND